MPELTPISRYLARLRSGAAITPNGLRTSLRGLSDLDRPGLLFTLITSDERGSVMDREWRNYPDPFLLARFAYLVRHGPGPVDVELFVEGCKDLAYAADVWEELKQFCSIASDDDPYTPTRLVMRECATERYRNWPTHFELSKVFRMGITDASEFHPSLAVPHLNRHLMGITKDAESSVSLTRLLAGSEFRRMSVAIDPTMRATSLRARPSLVYLRRQCSFATTRAGMMGEACSLASAPHTRVSWSRMR